jgi:hypothetical protein
MSSETKLGNCTGCKEELYGIENEHYVQCVYCNEWFCEHCEQTTEMSAYEIDSEYDEGDNAWVCKECTLHNMKNTKD